MPQEPETVIVSTKSSNSDSLEYTIEQDLRKYIKETIEDLNDILTRAEEIRRTIKDQYKEVIYLAMEAGRKDIRQICKDMMGRNTYVETDISIDYLLGLLDTKDLLDRCEQEMKIVKE